MAPRLRQTLFKTVVEGDLGDGLHRNSDAEEHPEWLTWPGLLSSRHDAMADPKDDRGRPVPPGSHIIRALTVTCRDVTASTGGARVGRSMSGTLLALVAVALAAMLLSDPLPAGASGSPGPSPSDTAPVNLSTPIDLANGMAHQSAIVRSGGARIEVISPTLLRLEYSPSGRFEDLPTVNAIDRRRPVPTYSAQVSGGWLVVRTTRVTLRYKVGSGPFSAANTSMRFAVGNQVSTVHPTWEWECPFDQTCQAGAAVLAGGASLSQALTGYQSTAGYVGYLNNQGASATWSATGAPAGMARVSIRYSNEPGSPPPSAQSTIDLLVNGRRLTTLVAAPTDSASPWSTLSTMVPLQSGTNAVEAVSGPNNFNLGIDSLSIGPADAPAPVPQQTDPLGGWIRGFDTFTYGPGATCTSAAGADCQTAIEPLHTDGLLAGAGWRLLDDTQSAVWTRDGWVQPRKAGGDSEDGYLFVYGHDYAGALRTFAQLTGPAPLLPRSVFGVWYSDYTPFSSAAVEDLIYPSFQKYHVPLDTLSLDTEWKAPNSWDGWEWNTTLFPDPGSFLGWIRSHGIGLTLNIHSSIADNDPALATAQRVAGTALASAPPSTCTGGPCRVWDWSSIPQAESNFALQQPFRKQGVAFWWLDWCCDESVASLPGLTPDSWIGHLYAQEMVNQGQRGFVLARVGSSNDYPEAVYPAGPWSNHTSAIAFTGDAWGTWNTLAQEVALTPDEATIGQPYVSDDIGSYLGTPGLVPQDLPDLYDRWVQFGTFQPVLRLHSANGSRLPWQYPEPVSGITEDFLRLREALIPYTYTLAAQAHDNGMPITQPLYLDYPNQPAAYAHPGEYLYGSDMLVVPVTTPGSVADTAVWIPPGRWVDYFTGATFTGPSTTTVSVPLSRMPVFVRAGGIIPQQSVASSSSAASNAHMSVDVYSGSGGAFTLYGDSGQGLGYTTGQYTQTPITDSLGAEGAHHVVKPSWVTVGPAHGSYPGEPTAVGWRLRMVDLTRPSGVTLNGHRIDPENPGSHRPGWYYQADAATVVVNTPSLPAAEAFTVVATGSRSVNRPEPPVPNAM